MWNQRLRVHDVVSLDSYSVKMRQINRCFGRAYGILVEEEVERVISKMMHPVGSLGKMQIGAETYKSPAPFTFWHRGCAALDQFVVITAACT